MTTPNQARSSGSRDGIRTYAWPPQPPHEMEVVSVTTAIKNGLPKPFLVGWAAKVTAEEAIKKHAIVGQLLEAGDERAAVDMIKGARYRDMGTKADRGTIVHAAIENYIDGITPDTDEIHSQLEHAKVPQKMWKSATNMVNGVMEFLQSEEPEIIWSEATVYSRAHRYAGTADMIARMRVGDEVVPVVIDIKTSKSIYDEVALQLAAYANADFVGMDNGEEKPLLGGLGIDPSPRIEYGIVVRPTPTGKYEKAVFALTPAVFDLFLAVLNVATGQDELRKVRRP